MSSGHDFTQPHHQHHPLHPHHPHPHPHPVTPSADTANNKPQTHSATELPQPTSSIQLPTSSSTFPTSPPPPRPPTMSCVYKSQSPTGKTILITTTGAATVAGLGTSQSANGGPGGISGGPNTGTASSQITIFTHHHHHASASAAAAAAMADGGHSSSVAVNTVHGHHGVSGAKSAAGSVGINILINNHFNEPAPAPTGGSGRPALLPTTVTIKEDAAGVKRERTMKSEPIDDEQPMEVGALCEVATADSSEQRALAADCEGTVIASKTALQTSTTTVTVMNTAGGVGGSVSHQHHHHLSVGDEVFAIRPDDSGNFHLGTIVVVQPPTQPAATGQCLVRFGDGQECWSAVSDVQRFSEREAAMPMCIVCKVAGGEVAHKCSECGRAFHPRCAGVRSDSVWFCTRGHRNEVPVVWRVGKEDGLEVEEEKAGGKMEVCGTEEEQQRAVVARVKRTMQLPYVLDALTWDKPHRQNAERTYCYCGRTGEWHTQMLQCVRCEQWFHERCAVALSYPLYCGDRFYVFACALCNGGVEFVRRQQMRLDDLVHLLLFNLSAHNPLRRYFDVATAIVPYAIDNWHTLQLAPKLRNMSVADIRERIAKCLANNPTRFKPRTSLSLCTPSSTTPRSSQFALCDRSSPPLAPTIPIALAARTQPLTDDLVAQLCRRQSLPLSGNNQHNGGGIQLVARSQIADGLVALSPEMRYTMSGRAYMKPRPTAAAVKPSSFEASVSSSSPSPSPSSATDEEDSDQFKSDDDDEVLANLGKKSLKPARNDRTNSSSANCYSTSINNNNNKTVALKLAAISNGAESSSSSSSSADIYDYCSAREEAEANALVPLRPSPNSSLTSNGSVGPVGVSTLPTTSPTESAVIVILKPTNAVGSSSNPSTNSTAVTTTHHQHKRKRGRPLAPSAIAAAIAESAPHCGGYSSDDNSSRGALDIIIPPPKDFQGLNNPFLSQPTQQLTHVAANVVGKNRPRGKGRGGRGTKGGAGGVVGGNLVQLASGAMGGVGGISAAGIGAITGVGCGAVNGAVRIVRTVKRRLSARDLVIGPNMEVKRRKVRRGSGGGGAGGGFAAGNMMVEVISTTTVVRTDFKDLPLTPMHHQVAGQSAPAVQTCPLQHIVVPPPPPPTLLSAYRPEQAYGIGGRRLRKRIDTNYAESGRRSGGNGGAAATVAVAAAAAAAAAAVNNSSNSNSCSSNSSSSASSSVGPASTTSSFSLISSSSSLSSSSSSSSTPSAFGAALKPEAGVSNAAPTPIPTPAAASVASAPAPSLTDLQSSLTMYFGAANRMANGERFAIRGKRVGLDGRRQYLIEWDSCS